MSHVYAYGVQCPKAKGIIHLGATSCYVGDNTDIITMTEAMKLIRKKLVNLMDKLSKFALEYKDLPCLGFTHFQLTSRQRSAKERLFGSMIFCLTTNSLNSKSLR